MKLTPILLLVLVAAVSHPIRAHADEVTYSCTYDTYSNEKGVHKVQDNFKLVFVLDTSKETARSLGSRGPIAVDLYYAPDGGLTFIEPVDGGKVLVTSIDRSHNTVHSRNVILQGHVSASQYYGTCSKR